MPISKDDIKRVLTSVRVPGFKADLVSGGCVEWIAVCDDIASLKLHVPDADPAAMETIANDAVQSLGK